MWKEVVEIAGKVRVDDTIAIPPFKVHPDLHIPRWVADKKGRKHIFHSGMKNRNELHTFVVSL